LIGVRKRATRREGGKKRKREKERRRRRERDNSAIDSHSSWNCCGSMSSWLERKYLRRVLSVFVLVALCTLRERGQERLTPGVISPIAKRESKRLWRDDEEEEGEASSEPIWRRLKPLERSAERLRLATIQNIRRVATRRVRVMAMPEIRPTEKLKGSTWTGISPVARAVALDGSRSGQRDELQ